ncbi:sensor histidine kinase [Anoxybacteroides tepidamans]|uniref:sensor histidine kinase n=1 Tax=Anoxybacteroides tepidamans TaxID=265948 RepID=UPI00047F682F|nr:ATP-binding protein [Anoxybacillus tepidamans]
MNKKVLSFSIILISIFVICYILLKMYNEHVSPQRYFPIFIGMIFLLTGIYSYVQKPNSIVVQYFLALMFISGMAIALSGPSSENIKPARELEVISISFAPYILLKFFDHFPSSAKPNFFRRACILTLFIAVFITISYLLIGIHHRLIISTIVRPGIVVNIILALLGCVVLFYLHLRSNSDKIKNQIYLLISSIIISFAPVVILNLIPNAFFSLSIAPFYYSLGSIVMFPLTLSYLLTRQEIVDFREILEKMMIRLFIIGSCLAIFNILLSLFYDIHFKFCILVNTLLICLFIVYDLINKGLEPLQMRKWHVKHEEIQKEKLTIIQHLLNGKHLEHCAKLIADLIHKTMDVSGVCIVWKNDRIPTVLHKTGIFLHLHDSELLSYNCQRHHFYKITINEKSVFFYPMNIDDTIIGWMMIGGKTNATVFDKEEQKLIKKIQIDAIELLASSKTLQQIENQLKKTAEESWMSEQSHWLLLHEHEEEKRKLSTFLHDEVLQHLILLLNKLEWLIQKKNIDKKLFEDIKGLLQRDIFEIREVCHELYPIMVEDLGLKQGLSSLKRKCETNYNVIVEVNYITNLKIISPFLSIQAFRIIKELVYNAIKHSSSRKIVVTVEETQQFLSIQVKDYGVGFKVPDHLLELSQTNHLGLVTIQKRVHQLKGTLTIQSELGAGTCISVSLPITVEEGGVNENQNIVSR